MTPLEEMQWFCVAHMHFCVASGLARSHGFRQVEGSQQHHVNTEHRTHVYAYTEDCQLMSARQQPAHVACQGQTCTLNLVHASLALVCSQCCTQWVRVTLCIGVCVLAFERLQIELTSSLCRLDG